MKKVLLILLLVAAGMGLVSSVTAATTVGVRIETPSKTIFNDSVSLPDTCIIKDKDGKDHKLNGNKAACALEVASKKGNFSYEVENSSFGLFLTTIAGNRGNATAFWIYRVNYKLAPVGIAEYEVRGSDQVLFSFGSSPLLPLQVQVNKNELVNSEDLVITTRVWDDNQSSFKDMGNTRVLVGDKSYTSDGNGKVTVSKPAAGTYPIWAEKDNYVRSERVGVKVTAPPPPSTTTTVPTPTPTPAPAPASAAQVASAQTQSLPRTGASDVFLASLLLTIIGGLYLKGKHLPS